MAYNKKLRAIILIPARVGSTRLPNKLLLNATGKSILQHTFEGASTSKKAAKVHIVTPDGAILREALTFTDEVTKFDADFPNGTARVMNLATIMVRDYDLFINVQADEPLIRGEMIDSLISYFEGYWKDGGNLDVATLVSEFSDLSDVQKPSVVKAAVENGFAYYFSRAPLAGAKKHLGVYGFSSLFVHQYPRLKPSKLRDAENLEQLQFLTSGYQIGAVDCSYPTIGIDTPEDYNRFLEYWNGSKA
jgi:3-deoxy-manno-octulosonate cytidylyltransferase (CMP-KDO synthetase)